MSMHTTKGDYDRHRGQVVLPFILALVVIGIPTLIGAVIAFGVLATYLGGYNSWRDTLYLIPFYIAWFSIAAAIMVISYLPIARQSNRPISLSLIALLHIIGAIGGLPIALALVMNARSDWHPAPLAIATAISVLPIASVVVTAVMGVALLGGRKWARRGSVAAMFGSAIIWGALIDRWWWLTATEVEDFLLFATSPLVVVIKHALLIFVLLAVVGVSIVWYCLSRPSVIKHFGK